LRTPGSAEARLFDRVEQSAVEDSELLKLIVVVASRRGEQCQGLDIRSLSSSSERKIRDMTEILLLTSFIGLSLGSFLNSCFYRIPRGIPLGKPRSFCPACLQTLAWFDLVPLVSYVVNGGKCRSCSSSIPASYPLTEIALCVLAVAFVLMYGLSLQALSSLMLCFLFLLIGRIDWVHFVVPNILVGTGFVVAFALKLSTQADLLGDLSASIFSFVFLLIVRVIGDALARRPSMGMGDLKLAALVGFSLGLFNGCLAIWMAALGGTVYTILRKNAHEKRIPFGSFMAASTIILVLLEKDIQEIADRWLNSIQ